MMQHECARAQDATLNQGHISYLNTLIIKMVVFL